MEEVGIGDYDGNMRVLALNEIEIALLGFIELAIIHEQYSPRVNEPYLEAIGKKVGIAASVR